MRQKVDQQDKIMFDDEPLVKFESNLDKWKGTGLEEELFKYKNPVEKRQTKPLFEKTQTYLTLDGPKKIITSPNY
jgi:hypothetical protein